MEMWTMSRAEQSADDVAAAAAVEAQSLPIIDFAPFLGGNPDDRSATAHAIAQACRDTGFFYLTGHGVPSDLIDAMFAQSRAFYGLPIEERRSVRTDTDNVLGWAPPRDSDSLSRNTRLFHQYIVQLGADAPNRWPPTLPDFAPTSERYLAAMHDLSLELLKAFAIGLGLPEATFADAFRAPPSRLNLLYQPPLPRAAAGDVSNMVSHTDEGPITILAQGATGGLEVKRRDGSWIKASPIPQLFIINVGDVMMWWTNGRYLSNFHRVRNRSGVERYSIPYFCYPDPTVTVAPLTELLTNGEAPKYPAIRIADLLDDFRERQIRHAAG
jgi:isopenicillin N synthase-like dioxygenase